MHGGTGFAVAHTGMIVRREDFLHGAGKSSILLSDLPDLRQSERNGACRIERDKSKVAYFPQNQRSALRIAENVEFCKGTHIAHVDPAAHDDDCS